MHINKYYSGRPVAEYQLRLLHLTCKEYQHALPRELQSEIMEVNGWLAKVDFDKHLKVVLEKDSPISLEDSNPD